jgi:galactose mutarotase-like enzyme
MSHAVTEGTREGIPMLTLSGPRLAASFAPGAGMVGCSLVHEGQELLGQRDGLAAYARTSATMGIPLLAPWANRVPADRWELFGREIRLDACSDHVHREENGLPIHGLLGGGAAFTVRAAEAEEGAARLAATVDVDLPCFPFPHAVAVEVILRDAELRVTTTVAATGDAPVPVAFGWHPYLTLPGAARESWRIELPVRRRTVFDDRGLPTGESEAVEPVGGALGDRTFDDGFDRLEPGRPFSVAGGGRRVEVAFEDGYPVAQVYAPPGSDFICFEPMTAPVAALVTRDGLRVLDPGQSASATFAVRVSSA